MKKFVLIIALSIVAGIAHAQEAKSNYAPGDYIPTVQSGKWGYKQFGEWVIEPRFDQAKDFADGLAAVSLYGKWGYISKTGESVTPYKYDQCGNFSEGIARVKLYGKWGFIDRTGTLVVPFKFTQASDMKNGLSKVTLGDKSGYVDKTGAWFDSEADMMQSFSAFARHYVEADINEWQRKGKYEKLSDWQARVNDVTRKKRIDSLFLAAGNAFIAAESKNVKQEYTIVDYDTESEVFLLHDSRFGNLLVSVPIREAEQFEKDFSKIRRDDVYCINGDNLGLKEARLRMPNGRVYKYNNTAALSFTSVDIEYNFESVPYDEESLALAQNNHKLSKKTLKTGPSDVDIKIPQTAYRNENTFALIIANEDYKFVDDVPYAENDGKVFEEYCIKTLGMPKEHIHRVKNATYGMMIGEMDWMSSVARVYKGDAKLIVYYAGHGIPDESSKSAFLLPVDGTGKNTSTAIKLSTLYSKLNEHPTTSTVVFLDACFSGAQRDGQMLAQARGVAIRTPETAVPGNLVVFSAASGDETAYSYDDKGHGLFSYFLLKKLQESAGDTTLGEMAEYLMENVSREALVRNSKNQTPTVTYSNTMGGQWKSIKLK